MPDYPTLGVPTLINPTPFNRSGIRARVADAVARLGGQIQRALFDLAVRVDPRLGPPIIGPRWAWVGLTVLILLVIGIAAVTGGAVWAIRETLPHREYRP